MSVLYLRAEIDRISRLNQNIYKLTILKTLKLSLHKQVVQQNSNRRHLRQKQLRKLVNVVNKHAEVTDVVKTEIIDAASPRSLLSMLTEWGVNIEETSQRILKATQNHQMRMDVLHKNIQLSTKKQRKITAKFHHWKRILQELRLAKQSLYSEVITTRAQNRRQIDLILKIIASKTKQVFKKQEKVQRRIQAEMKQRFFVQKCSSLIRESLSVASR